METFAGEVKFAEMFGVYLLYADGAAGAAGAAGWLLVREGGSGSL